MVGAPGLEPGWLLTNGFSNRYRFHGHLRLRFGLCLHHGFIFKNFRRPPSSLYTFQIIIIYLAWLGVGILKRSPNLMASH